MNTERLASEAIAHLKEAMPGVAPWERLKAVAQMLQELGEDVAYRTLHSVTVITRRGDADHRLSSNHFHYALEIGAAAQVIDEDGNMGRESMEAACVERLKAANHLHFQTPSPYRDAFEIADDEVIEAGDIQLEVESLSWFEPQKSLTDRPVSEAVRIGLDHFLLEQQVPKGTAARRPGARL